MATHSTDAKGRLARVPEKLVRLIGNNILVKNTTQYTFNKTQGGIIMPGADDDDLDKKYRFGEVIAVGPLVPTDQVDVGDIVVYQSVTGYRMPNGQETPVMYRISFSEGCIMLVLPNLDKPARTKGWAKHAHIKDIEAEVKQWKSGEEKPVK